MAPSLAAAGFMSSGLGGSITATSPDLKAVKPTPVVKRAVTTSFAGASAGTRERRRPVASFGIDRPRLERAILGHGLLELGLGAEDERDLLDLRGRGHDRGADQQLLGPSCDPLGKLERTSPWAIWSSRIISSSYESRVLPPGLVEQPGLEQARADHARDGDDPDLVLDRGLEQQGAFLAAGIEAEVAALGGTVPGDVVGDLPVAELARRKSSRASAGASSTRKATSSSCRLIRLDLGAGEKTHAGLVRARQPPAVPRPGGTGLGTTGPAPPRRH